MHKQNVLRHFLVILGLVAGLGCGGHPEVAAEDCGKIVSHAQKLLGSKADPASKLMSDCKKASGSERGCALAAQSAADLLRCTM